jgi:hypothetical protein
MTPNVSISHSLHSRPIRPSEEALESYQKDALFFFHCFTLKMQGIAEQTPVQLTQIDRLAAAD